MVHKNVLALPPNLTLVAHVLEHLDDAMARLVPNGSNARLVDLVGSAVEQLRRNVPPGRSAAQVGCMEAGLWLLADELGQCHTICQDIATPEGSAWHAIMHRREGDFSNALYWWRRVGALPWANPITGGSIVHEARMLVAGETAANSSDAGASGPAGVLEMLQHWKTAYDPAAFAQAVATAYEEPATPLYAALVRIGRLEWLSHGTAKVGVQCCNGWAWKRSAHRSGVPMLPCQCLRKKGTERAQCGKTARWVRRGGTQRT